MNPANFFPELLVVVVLYKTKPEESAAYTSLQTALNILPSVPEIFIYDNSPLASPPPVGIYFHDPLNSGVSRAYNTASTHALRKNKKWMLLLDQDTTISVKFFQELADAVVAHPETMAFAPQVRDSGGLVSPFYFALGRGKRIEKASSKLSLQKYRFINSGLLIRLTAFIEVGGYDENIPLDFSDIAFANRLRNVTNHFVVVDASLDHKFSGAQAMSADEALFRFQSFRAGARALGKKTGSGLLYAIRILMRASLLFYRHKDFRFLTALLHQSTND